MQPSGSPKSAALTNLDPVPPLRARESSSASVTHALRCAADRGPGADPSR